MQSEVTIVPNTPLHGFYSNARPLTPSERSALFSARPVFGEIHSSVSDAGQSAVPSTDEHPDQGYTCFVSVPGEGSTGRRIFELDGGRKGPVDHGECTDLLEDVVGRIIKDEYVAKSESVKFSIMYLGKGL
jgi:ubiquitin carboxyl-terminal hydrolase L3